MERLRANSLPILHCGSRQLIRRRAPHQDGLSYSLAGNATVVYGRSSYGTAHPVCGCQVVVGSVRHLCPTLLAGMLSSVWKKFVPGGRSCHTHEAQQTQLETLGESLPARPPAEVREEGSSVGVRAAPAQLADHLCSCMADHCKSVHSQCICTAQHDACSCPVSRSGCLPDKCGCTEHSHGRRCTTCSCGCSHKELSGANVDIHRCGTDAALTHNGPQESRMQIPTEFHEGSRGSHTRAGKAKVIGGLTRSDCLPVHHSSSCETTACQDHQRTASQEVDAQNPTQWLTVSLALPREEGSAISARSDSGYPEGWEHIRSDDIYATCMRSDEATNTGKSLGNKPIREAVRRREQEAGTNEASGCIAGRSSPSAEFEIVADAPWCDVRRLLRLSTRQQPRGWEWACSGLTSSLLRDRSKSTNAAEAVAVFRGSAEARGTGAGAAISQRASRQSCPVVRFLRSAMYSSILSGSDFIRRHGTPGRATPGTGANAASESSPAIPTGWSGRWQLTPIDSPQNSLISCCNSDRRSQSAPVLPFASSCKDGGSLSGSQRDHLQQQTQLQHVPACVSNAARPRSPVGSPSLAGNSGTQRGTLAAAEGNATVLHDSEHVASEVEAPPSATEVSDHAESGRCRISARRLNRLLLHHAQQQGRKNLKKKDVKLNILITALQGVDARLFCRQMFAEWQEISRQQVSCGEEFIFRAPFAVPAVEVPVITATSFASVLPYCELRLLEEWERDTVLRQQPTERRIHVCLFLISHSALPLSTGVLALLKRLRAVACMLPLLIVQRTTPSEQIAREGILRLQLAASDLATLEELLPPLHAPPGGPDVCAHCQRRMQKKEYQQPEGHYEPKPPLQGKGLRNSDTARTEKCPDGTNPQAQEPQALKPENYAASVNNSRSSGSTKTGRHRLTVDDYSRNPDTQEQRAIKSDDYAGSLNNSRSSGSSKIGSLGQPIGGRHEKGRRDGNFEGGGALASRHRRKMQVFSRVHRCLSEVHLPLVLQLATSDTKDDTASRCTCREGIDNPSDAVTTPLLLRVLLVETSAVLLRQRAEYGCFLPFLFQQQMLSNRTHKLRGLQQWENEEEHQKEQQQHVEALVDLRQGQIDSHPNKDMAIHMQKQLDAVRKQVCQMQQQLVYLQERRFLQQLLTEEEAAARPYRSPHSRVLLNNSDTESGEREELLSQVAQTGLVLALMVGVGALLFNSMKRGNG